MASFDRRNIVPLLLPHYPQLADMNTHQIQAFLNGECGTNVGDETPNGTAFDDWRRVLKDKKSDPKLWPYTDVDLRTFREKETEMKEAEEKRRKEAEERLSK